LITYDRTVGDHHVRLADLDLRCQCLETANYDGVLVWKISDYIDRKRQAVEGRVLSLYSQPFYTSRYGYKMCARVYLNGDGTGRNTHLSLFFVVMQVLSSHVKESFNFISAARCVALRVKVNIIARTGCDSLVLF